MVKVSFKERADKSLSAGLRPEVFGLKESAGLGFVVFDCIRREKAVWRSVILVFIGWESPYTTVFSLL